MNTTVLLFHPNLAASRINARLAQAARGAGTAENPVEVRDMYALYPDFKVDVAAEQAVCEATDRIHGKEVAISASLGAPASSYDRSGEYHYELHELLRPFQAMSNMVGTRFVAPFFTAEALNLTDADLELRADAYHIWLTSEHPELDLLG